MPFEVTLDEERAIVRVRVYGAATHAEHLAARREAARLSVSRGWPRVLTDLRDLKTKAAVSTMTCYEFGSTYQEEQGGRVCRFATLMPLDAQAREDVKFTTTVGANRGTIVRLFTDEQQALEWLLEPSAGR